MDTVKNVKKYLNYYRKKDTLRSIVTKIIIYRLFGPLFCFRHVGVALTGHYIVEARMSAKKGEASV